MPFAVAADGPDYSRKWSPPNTALPKTASVSGQNVTPVPARKPEHPVPPTWTPPKGLQALPSGHASVTLGTAPEAKALGAGESPQAGAEAKASGLPVTVAPLAGSSAAGQTIQVDVADAKSTAAAGIPGVALTLTRPGAGDDAPVRLGVDASSLDTAFGADWAARAHLVVLPACATTTPKSPDCQKQTPLDSHYDPATKKLVADVPLTGTGIAKSATIKASAPVADGAVRAVYAGDTTTSTTVAVVSGSSSGAGTYAATPLAPSQAWTGGAASGAFTYGYPIQAPPALAGSGPKVALSYDSSSVDGKTSSTNSQASWIGDGWDYSPGFVERSFKPCSLDGIAGSGDQCWGGANMALSLGGHSGQLVPDDASCQSGAPAAMEQAACTWRLKNDDGTKIQFLTGATNGTWNGSYIKVTDTGGTVYYFGLNHVPDANGNPTTLGADSGSAWTVPVFSPNSGDPCYDPAKGQGSWCQTAWRWNLDFTVDPHGNLVTNTYTPETNYYSLGGGQGNGTSTVYTRSGVPSSIGYGQLLSDQLNNGGTYNPAAKIVFNTAERCDPSSGVCDPSQRTAANAPNWPDVPLDQQCDATSGCTNYGPTFWTTKWLSSIVTQVRVNGTYQTVDSYALNHTFVNAQNPTENTKVPWLASVQRTGQDTQASGTPVPLQPVSFTPMLLPNRVDGTNLVPAPPAYNRPRIQMITTETGGTIGVNYAPADCSRVNNVMPASADSDTLSCYNVKWNPPGSAAGATPVDDWFQKYPVATVTTNPGTPGSTPMVTSYSYGKAAWHRNDSATTRDNARTWDQFRGYASVTAITGSGNDGPKSQSSTTYYQGMDGDVLASGTTRSVSVAGPMSGQVTDSDWLSGETLESDTYAQAGGSVVGYSVSTSSGPVPTATHSQGSSMPALTARYNFTGAVTTSRSLKSDGTWGTVAKTVTSDPAHGNRLLTSLETADGLPDICARTNYAAGSDPQVQVLPSEVIAVSGSNACTATPTAANTVSWARTAYDGQGVGQLGTAHDATTTFALDHYDASGNAQFTSVNQAYDGYGRLVSVTDPDATDSAHPGGATTTTAYTASTAGELPGTVSVTTPAPAGASDTATGRTTTTTLDTARALTIKTTDPNGRAATKAYDALGRVTSVWAPGRATTASASATVAYSTPGMVNGNAVPPTVTSSTLLANGKSYAVGIQIMDGMGRVVQTQSTPAHSAYTGRLITDTVYDSQGRVTRSNSPWYNNDSAPSTTLFQTTTQKVPAQTYNVYDGLGRPVTQQFVAYGVTQNTTTTAYPGADRTDTTPPAGTTPTSVVTDVHGHTAQLWQYKTATATGNPADADVTSYSYTAAGQLASHKDAAGNTWTRGYDLRGREVTATDPDTGTSTKTYDTDGRLASTADARGQTVAYTYDLLGRPTGSYAGSVAPANQLTGSTYDTVLPGLPATSTRYVGGASGSAYTSSVLSYDTAYHPTKTTITIPGTEIGQGTTPFTYTYQARFDPITGAVAADNRSAVGDIAQETINYTYETNGLLSSFGAFGGATYDVSSDWDAYGRSTRATVNPWGTQIVVTNTYDESTGRPLSQFVDKQTAATGAVQQVTYAYNAAGRMTAVRNIPNNIPSSTDLQCFNYDYLGRLTNSWTDTGTLTQAPQPTVGGIGSCANSTPTSGVQAPLKTTVGGPAAYWQSYGYDLTGNRTQLVQHDPSGDTTKDTTTNQTFPATGTVNTPTTAPNTGGGTGGPHALTTTNTTSPNGTSASSAQYDAAGNTTAVTDTSGTAALTWNGEDKLASYAKTGTAGPTTYLYDASGNQLIRRDPGKTTINLGGDELVYNGSTVTGVRYYQIPGGVTLVRQGGTSTYQIADPHGTGNLALDGTTLAESRRPSDPFGNPRGTQPTTWAGDHGFVGGTKDDATGLTNLGAREYQPTTGRFLNPDPLLDTGDPQQWNAYAYSNNDPQNLSDPSGLKAEECGQLYDCHGGTITLNNTAETSSYVQSDVQRRYYETFKDDTQNVTNQWVKAQITKHPGVSKPMAVIHDESEFYKGFKHAVKGAVESVTQSYKDAKGCVTGDGKACKSFAVDVFNSVPVVAAIKNDMGLLDTARQMVDQVKNGQGEYTAGEITGLILIAMVAHKVGERFEGASGPCKNSFPPDTPVLMADGTTKAIGDIKPDDTVTATDPQTGKTSPEPVTAKIVTPDDTQFTELTLSTSTGKTSPQANTTLVSTAHHPYWDETAKTWADAQDLEVGHQLETPDHGLVVLLATRTYITAPQAAHNLTVANLHTYYVLAGSTPVLVHNCGDNLPEGVTVEHADNSITIAHSDSGSMTIALLDDQGKLTLGMDRLPGSPLSGKQMFGMVMDHFGDRVQSIEGNWSYGDNLKAFNSLVAGGTPLKSAARSTWTGQRAAEYGFTSARITRAIPSLDGDYAAVSAQFWRP
ncbi:RHS repeat-associated core domain-containing protein [Kitasatospora sp. NPDC059722]|uniref:RHS repeat-associated core domain-containing protein n=1 Tax=Kitasatospora sp. NPDC059722 TaxID=3346925 RepID=UPI00367BD272